ncbi:MAG TPA: ribosome silencing factor, partial [Clostridiales bacterium]|nr:ribosome silencing factor [Clostridiales bacterium]
MSKELVEKIVNILDDKKAVDIEVIKIKELTIIADYFVIASGTSNTHLKALADELEFKLAEEDIRPRQIEGKATGSI